MVLSIFSSTISSTAANMRSANQQHNRSATGDVPYGVSRFPHPDRGAEPGAVLRQYHILLFTLEVLQTWPSAKVTWIVQQS